MRKLFRLLLLLPLGLLCCIPALADTLSPSFSLADGFYSQPQQLEITFADASASIYYTTDGSVPDASDHLYEGPLTLSWTTGMDDPLSHMTGISPEEAFLPQEDFPTGHIIRAVALSKEGKRSGVTSGTYFVGYDRQALYGDTPLMLLAADPADLFDQDRGIYVLGSVFEAWAAAQTEAWASWEIEANFTQRGSDWERPVAVTFLPAKGEGFSEAMGLRIKGGTSRTHAQKSLRLIARSAYGVKNIRHPLLPGNLRASDGQIVQRYKSFTLRNGGNDRNHAFIRDPYIHRLAEGLRLETLSSMPVVAFLNGEYWGMYTLVEEYSDNYVEYHYGIDHDNVITVKASAEAEGGRIEDGQEEDYALFSAMLDWILGEDMSDPVCYGQACAMLDMGSFADLCALELYILNEDGPFIDKNWQMWRVRTPGADNSPYADGQWRAMLYDTDYSAGIYTGADSCGEDNLSPLLADEPWPWRDPSGLLRSLLESEDFRQRFVLAMCDVRNLYFSPARTSALLEEMSAQYLPLAADTVRRFGPLRALDNPEAYLADQMARLGLFFEGRYGAFPAIVQGALGLSDHVEVTIRSSAPEKGSVCVNGRSVLPEDGQTLVYFPDYSITVSAVPGESTRFLGWEVTGPDAFAGDPASPVTDVTFTGPVTITALFE